jgi:hypothetical protein
MPSSSLPGSTRQSMRQRVGWAKPVVRSFWSTSTMLNRIGAVIAAIVAGLFGWAAATAFFVIVLDLIVGNFSRDSYGHLDLIMAIPCGAVMLPSWLYFSLFAYARLRPSAPARSGQREK